MRGEETDMHVAETDTRPAEEEVRGGINIAEWLGEPYRRACDLMKAGEIPGTYKRGREWILLKPEYWRGVRRRIEARATSPAA